MLVLYDVISLAELGYEYKVKLKKPLLTLAHKNARLLWWQERQGWTWKEWENVMFSDESTFFLFKGKNVTKIWRTAREQMTTDCISAVVQGGGTKLGFWDVVSAKGGIGCWKLYAQNTYEC